MINQEHAYKSRGGVNLYIDRELDPISYPVFPRVAVSLRAEREAMQTTSRRLAAIIARLSGVEVSA